MIATSRLRKEAVSLERSPPPFIRAKPMEGNILHFHYVIQGPPDTPYAGGYYHGVLRFPEQYPLKPPEILMYTPSGRFEPGKTLCLSMSSFHPETWNPLWSVSTVLVGLLSFMLENQSTVGSIETDTATKRRLARESLAYNCKNRDFRKLFPDLAELEANKAVEAAAGAGATEPQPVETAIEAAPETKKSSVFGVVVIGIAVVVAIVVAAVQQKKLEVQLT